MHSASLNNSFGRRKTSSAGARLAPIASKPRSISRPRGQSTPRDRSPQHGQTIGGTATRPEHMRKVGSAGGNPSCARGRIAPTLSQPVSSSQGARKPQPTRPLAKRPPQPTAAVTTGFSGTTGRMPNPSSSPSPSSYPAPPSSNDNGERGPRSGVALSAPRQQPAPTSTAGSSSMVGGVSSSSSSAPAVVAKHEQRAEVHRGHASPLQVRDEHRHQVPAHRQEHPPARSANTSSSHLHSGATMMPPAAKALPTHSTSDTSPLPAPPRAAARGAPSPRPAPSPPVVVFEEDPSQPLAPHDMDMAFFKDPSHWNKKLTPATAALMSGRSLEPPYTTALWKQAYDDPSTIAGPMDSPDSPTGSTPLQQHVYSDKLTSGYYACARCGTPACAPRNQRWHPTYPGLAVFTKVHTGGLRVEISAEAHFSKHAKLNFTVFCINCHGCLGAVSLAEVPSAGASPPENAALPSQQQPTGETAELFIANSACLMHVKFRTRAPMDGMLVDACCGDDDVSTSDDVSGGGTGGWSMRNATARSTNIKQSAQSADSASDVDWGLDCCDDNDDYFTHNEDSSSDGED